MNSDPYPFSPPESWDADERQEWRDQIVVIPKILQVYDGQQPVVISGEPGSGVTTMLDLIRERERANRNLVVEWEPQGQGIDTLFDAVTNALVRVVMTCGPASRKKAATTLPLLNEVLSIWFWWLTSFRHNGNAVLTRRWFDRWLLITNTMPFENITLDRSNMDPLLVLDLLSDLLNWLGFKEVVCFADHLTVAMVAHLEICLRSPSLRDAFGVRPVSGVPTDQFARFRVNPHLQRLRLTWEWDELWEICRRLLQVVPDGPVALALSPGTANALQRVVTATLGQTPHGTWVLAKSLYWLAHRHDGAIPDDLDMILYDLYQRSIPLRYDQDAGMLYHGRQPLPPFSPVLQETFDCFYERRGQLVSIDDLRLALGKNTSENYQQRIRRLRAVIEPVRPPQKQGPWIYLTNDFGEGFRLEHCI